MKIVFGADFFLVFPLNILLHFEIDNNIPMKHEINIFNIHVCELSIQWIILAFEILVEKQLCVPSLHVRTCCMIHILTTKYLFYDPLGLNKLSLVPETKTKILMTQLPLESQQMSTSPKSNQINPQPAAKKIFPVQRNPNNAAQNQLLKKFLWFPLELNQIFSFTSQTLTWTQPIFPSTLKL